MPARLGAREIDRWALAVSSAIGSDENAFDLWVRIFDLLLEFRNVRKARSFSLDGRVGLAEKVTLFRTALEEDLGSPLPENANRLIVPLVETNGWKALPRLRESVIRTFDLRVGRVNVGIASPEPLSRDLQGKVLAALETVVNEEVGGAVKTGTAGAPVRLSVRPEWTTRPALLAGMEIRIGSRVWDASLSARLRALERQLLATH